MKRIIAMLLLAAMLVNLTGCFGMFFDNTKQGEQEEPIPYLENYVFNDMVPTDSLHYEPYPYKDANSKPLIMGGNLYHGGFMIGYSVGPYVPGYATFDVSHLEGKKLSFLVGSTQWGFNFLDQHSIFQVLADDKVVVDTVAWPTKAPERFVIDLTGVSTLTFRIVADYDGENWVAVSEITAWDGEPVATGPAIASDMRSMQLVKELKPFAFRHTMEFFTQQKISAQLLDASNQAKESVYYQYAKTLSVPVGGIARNEGIYVHTAAALIGERVDYVVFNTEKQFSHLSFTVGGTDTENDTAGSSWVVVYADSKMVSETLVVSNSLPQQVTVNIQNCQNLRIEIIYEDGGDHGIAIYDAWVAKSEEEARNPGNASGGVAAMADVSKLISNIKPYAVASYAEDPLYDGVTQHKTFSMAGRKYNEGVILLSVANWLSGNVGSHVCFNLEGQFQYLTFTAGILDKTPCTKNDALNIYLDGVLSQTIEMSALDLPQKHTVFLNGCKELKIELVGIDTPIRPAYGIANMVVYKDEVVENDLFPDPVVDFPDRMVLLENIPPYLYNFAPGEMGDYECVYTGSQQHGFKLGDEWHYEGFILKTAVYADLYGDAMNAALMMAGVWSMAVGGLCLLAADTVYESSFAAFDLHGEFATVTFTVACMERYELWNTPQTEILKIGSNDKLYAELEIGSRMEPTTYTIQIENTEQLVFWLDCDPDKAEIGGSSFYAIYDVIVEK